LANLNDVYTNGSMENRLYNNLNLSFKYVKAESIISSLRNIAVSTGAACSSATLKKNHVLKAIGVSDELSKCSIRFGLGRFNTEEEIDYTIESVVDLVNKIRSISPMKEISNVTANS